MCIVFLMHNHNASKKYKLILASNRDEYLSRPTDPAKFDTENILCGRDLQYNNNGTWLGMNSNGKFAALTNYLVEKVDETKQSRGTIIREYLMNTDNSEKYCDSLKSTNYRAFNILAGEVKSNEIALTYFSNKSNQSENIPYGINVLACSLLNTKWKKVERGKMLFKNILEDNRNFTSDDDLANVLFEQLLSDKYSLYPDSLIEEQGKDRIPIEMLKKYCSIQVTDVPAYGTGVQTVILIDHENNVKYIERSLDLEQVAKGFFNCWKEWNTYSFKLELKN